MALNSASRQRGEGFGTQQCIATAGFAQAVGNSHILPGAGLILGWGGATLRSETPRVKGASVLPARRPVARLVLLNAMIPKPGETGLEWWEATGHQAAQRSYPDSIGLAGCDPMRPAAVFAHDLDDELRRASVGQLSVAAHRGNGGTYA